MKLKSTGMRRTALARSIGRSNIRPAINKPLRRYPYYAICVDNRGNPASLILGKAYRVIKPRKDDPNGMFRVIDEDGEDYLYDSRQFVQVHLGGVAQRRLTKAVS